MIISVKLTIRIQFRAARQLRWHAPKYSKADYGVKKITAAESEGGPRRRNFVSLRGKQKFLVDVHSLTHFLFARPSVQFRFCRAKRGNQSVSFKKGSDFVKQTHSEIFGVRSMPKIFECGMIVKDSKTAT